MQEKPARKDEIEVLELAPGTLTHARQRALVSALADLVIADLERRASDARRKHDDDDESGDLREEVDR